MISRRNIVGGLATVTAVGALPEAFRSTFAAPNGDLRIRYDATSAPGKDMLKIYAAGVRIMQTVLDKTDVMSWTFQWYTHFVTGSSTKQQEIDRIFGTGTSPAKTQALLMWSTCQAHSRGQQEFNFLPWHRAYVFYFESIVRKLTKRDEFTLPYWNYTVDGAIPPEFRMKDDKLFGPLYVANRNPGVNDGAPIASKEALNLDSMKLADFSPGPSGVPAGFNNDLDAKLHGTVHVKTGDPRNMGSVPYAAGDPVFWLHHANIDRIWAGWNAAGRPNPASDDWKHQVHAFVSDDGATTRIENEKLVTTAALGYKYDMLPVPPQPVLVSSLGRAPADIAVAADRPAAIASLATKLTLGKSVTSAKLQPNASIMAERAPANAEPKQSYLLIGNLETNIQPGVIYNVYAVPNTGAPGGTKEYIGIIQFFDAKTNPSTDPAKFVFDVTGIVARQKGVPLSYEFAPDGTPASDAFPVVGSMSIITR